MSTDTITPASLVQRLEEGLDHAAQGIWDPAEMRAARERMNCARKELHRRIGIVDIAVDLIRDARNS